MLIRTLKFKVDLSKEEYLPLLLKCSELFNYYTDWAYKNKCYNKNTCHKETYRDAIEKFKLPTALIQSIRDTALEACKCGKFKCKRPIKKSYSGIRLGKTAFCLRGPKLSIISNTKRTKTILHIPDYYREVFDNWKYGGADLTYDKKKKQFWLNISFKKEQTPVKPSSEKVLGIDRGLYNIATLSNGNIIPANKIRSVQRKFLYKRKQLQQKGTRSAKRKLRAMSGQEKRFMKDANHCLTKKIANMDYNVFVVEKLTGIRQIKRGKKLNGWLSKWAFYQFEQFLNYKAESLCKSMVYIDPRYTSKKCSCCKNMHSTIRNKSHFKCNTCGYTDHADVNAAKNIRDNYILSTIVKTQSIEQAPVNEPNVTKV